ncbi:hypothetical protein AMECASPLE_039380 [Ameca splendens]|uniref:Secreted protein n=1 Tax=Ameca splendens TaxID=208324 RepID=A0ABV0XXB3_9TELE
MISVCLYSLVAVILPHASPPVINKTHPTALGSGKTAEDCGQSSFLHGGHGVRHTHTPAARKGQEPLHTDLTRTQVADSSRNVAAWS